MTKENNDVMNEYELQRLENIRKNEEILKQLNIPELVNSFRKPKPKPRPKAEKKPTQPMRKSLRLRGVKAEEAPEAKRRAEEEAIKVEKKARLEGILALHAIRSNTSIDETNQFIGILSDLSMVKDSRKESDEVKRSQTDEINFDSVPGGKEGLNAIRWRCRSLSLSQTEEWSSVKVTPERIYCVSIHPSKEKILVSAGDKLGSLGFWSVNESNMNEHGNNECQTFMFEAHTRTITCSKYSPTNSNMLFTCSYDGSIRYFDLNQARFMEAFVDEDYTYTHIDIDPTGQIIYFATNEGIVGIKDIREPTTVFTGHRLHDKKVGCVSLNPKCPDLMVTASLDRKMRLWDIRKLGSDSNIQEFTFTNAVTSAFWSPMGDQVASTSYDNFIRVFNYDEERKLKERIQIPHNNQVGSNSYRQRWVTMFRATWNPNPNLHPHFIIGNLKRSSDVFSAVTGELIWNMHDEKLSAVPAVNAFHPKLNLIVAGSSSGRMIAWQEKRKVTPVIVIE
ncbi:11769_t:CDS:2 [Funneliformis geosporum]|uniref:DNA damage-binding protein CMR1 n=1 Tax=Funneliformis geosporum TaxID=1117311 RepID=A0A9W4SEJ0_9GLOM|nr:11769_t:CDS:2 [Funneliformis geosporum]CAI2164243.1 719_t:CDS:2 [Funneliformis geosporum]